MFEAPDHSAPALKPDWTLNEQQTETIIGTVKTAAEDCGAQIGVLFNPIESCKDPLIHTGEHKWPDRNDDETDDRWSAVGLRLLARIPPAAPTDIAELRVCVVGNVDSGTSYLLRYPGCHPHPTRFHRQIYLDRCASQRKVR